MLDQPHLTDSTPVDATHLDTTVLRTWGRSRTLVAVILGVGISLRLLEYLARRSLWTDESWAALDVGTRSPLGLLIVPHRFTFLLVEWAATRLGGMNELALRAVPLGAGILVLFTFSRLARRLLKPNVVWLAVSLAALSPALVYFSNEAKAYGMEVLFTVLLAGCALDVLESASDRAAWVRLLIMAGLALFISIPAAFVIAGIGVGLAIDRNVRRHPTAKWWLAAGGAFGAAALAALYIGLYRRSSAELRLSWEGAFMTPGSPDFANRAWIAARTMTGEYFVGGRPEPLAVVLAAAFFLAGLAAIARERGRAVVVILGGPILAAITASVMRLYPVAPRSMVFALPLVILALAAGVGWLVEQLPAASHGAVLALAGALWLGPAFGADLDRITVPQLPEAPRPVVHDFNRKHPEGEPVYVTWHGESAWLFYTTDWAAPDTARIKRMRLGPGVYLYRGRCELIGTSSGVEWRIPTGDHGVEPLPGWAEEEAARMRIVARPYIWLFFSHYFTKERTALLDALRRTGGHAVYAFETDGAALYRYRFDTTPATSTHLSGQAVTDKSPREKLLDRDGFPIATTCEGS